MWRRERVSCTYRRTDSGQIEKYWDSGQPQEMRFFRASGGMYATAQDYAEFLQMWLDKGAHPGGRLLSPGSVVAALSPNPLTERSSGTRRPIPRAVLAAIIATASLAQRIDVGRSAILSKRRAAASVAGQSQWPCSTYRSIVFKPSDCIASR